jgi:hypothetical protein
MIEYWRSHYIRIPDKLIWFSFPILRPFARRIVRYTGYWHGWWAFRQFQKTVFFFYIKTLRKDEERCEICKDHLRRGGDLYHGGITVPDAISDPKPRTAYVCNLCYKIHA